MLLQWPGVQLLRIGRESAFHGSLSAARLLQITPSTANQRWSRRRHSDPSQGTSLTTSHLNPLLAFVSSSISSSRRRVTRPRFSPVAFHPPMPSCSTWANGSSPSHKYTTYDCSFHHNDSMQSADESAASQSSRDGSHLSHSLRTHQSAGVRRGQHSDLR